MGNAAKTIAWIASVNIAQMGLHLVVCRKEGGGLVHVAAARAGMISWRNDIVWWCSRRGGGMGVGGYNQQ
jgi:hypothetical protein